MKTLVKDSERNLLRPSIAHPEDTINLVITNLLETYQERVDQVGCLINRIFEILKNFHRQQEENICQLREKLAQKASLRKKDFDLMMSKIISSRKLREEEVQAAIAAFLKTENQLIENLRTKPLSYQTIQDLTKLKTEIINQQKAREYQIAQIFRAFQQEEEELSLALKKLLEKKGTLKVIDFKATLTVLERQNSRKNREIEELFEAFANLRASINQDWNVLKAVLKKVNR